MVVSWAYYTPVPGYYKAMAHMYSVTALVHVYNFFTYPGRSERSLSRCIPFVQTFDSLGNNGTPELNVLPDNKLRY